MSSGGMSSGGIDSEDIEIGELLPLPTVPDTPDTRATPPPDVDTSKQTTMDSSRTVPTSPNSPQPPGGDPHMTEQELHAAEGYSWDLIMVFPTEELGKLSAHTSKCIKQIIAAKLQTRVYFSCQNDEVYCEIRASLARLRQFADFVDRRVLLDEKALKEAAEAGYPAKGVNPISINADPAISKKSPYQEIYGKFDRDPRLEALYAPARGQKHPFSTTLRLQLITDILKASFSRSGANLNPERMLLDGELLAFFPKHNMEEKEDLKKVWLSRKTWPWQYPIDRIRDYFGEKIGLYFNFITHYTTWLAPMALWGLIVAIVVYATDDTEHAITLAFAPSMVFWAILMLEYWKRQEKEISLKWGMIGFEEEEADRPEYHGNQIKSPVDGSDMLYFPPKDRMARIRMTLSIITSMILVVIGCIAGIYGLKWYLVYGTHTEWGYTYGKTITSFVNTIQITILNYFYKAVALKLTKWENHRTETEYEDALVVKLFSFQGVNSWGSFFYLAFIGEPLLGNKCESPCMSLLAQNLLIIFVTNIVVGNTIEVFVPWVMYKMKLKKEMKGVENAVLSQAEKEYMLVPYDHVLGTLMDYAEMALQFGYLTLFVVSFPLAPTLAFISNIVEIKSDGYKLLTQLQRPVPRGAEDIGKWQDVFSFIAQLAVITNAGLICLIYGEHIGQLVLSDRLWCFIGFTAFGLLFIKGLEAIVPDVPYEVELQLKRQDFLVSKVIDLVADEDDDDFAATNDKELALIEIEVGKSVS